MRITDIEILDLRFPTARAAVGTDAMHPDPDYSAAYVILKTDSELEGHGLTFTPLEKTFWAKRFGMVIDRFGVPWLINCEGSEE